LLGSTGNGFSDDVEDLFRGAIGFDEAVIGAGVPGVLNEATEVGVREDDNGKGGGCRGATDAPEDFDAVELGQHEVEDDGIGAVVFDGGQALFAIDSEANVETFRLELAPVDAANDLVVFDNENLVHAVPDVSLRFLR
jgi:hypothetical protein